MLRKAVGHPAKNNADVRKLYKTMWSAVELTRDLNGRFLDHEHYRSIKAAGLGLMYAYADITGVRPPVTTDVDVLPLPYKGALERQNPGVRKLFKTMKASVELVNELDGRFKDEQNFIYLKAAALGLMYAYADLTGLPAPDSVVGEVFDSVVTSVA